jgi:hypothetical protein
VLTPSLRTELGLRDVFARLLILRPSLTGHGRALAAPK